MNHKNGLSVRRVLFIFLFGLSFLTLLAISVLWIYSEVLQTHTVSKDLKKMVLSKQEFDIKAQAKMAVNYTETMMENSPNMPVKKVQALVLSMLEKIRFGYAGYVYVNTFDGKALIFDGKIVKGTKSIRALRDPEGNNLYMMEYGAAIKPKGGFIKYFFKKMNADVPQPKLAYIIGVPQWKWMIGAGDYTIDAKSKARLLSESLYHKLKVKVLLISLVFIVMSIAAFFLSDFLSNVFSKQIKVLLYHFESKEDDEIDEGFFKIKEFKKLALDIKKIENDKKEGDLQLEKTLKNMERDVAKRTQELETKNRELERYNSLFIDREFRIKELREEVKLLKTKIKEAERKG